MPHDPAPRSFGDAPSPPRLAPPFARALAAGVACALAGLLAAAPTFAQTVPPVSAPRMTLHAALNKSKGYVVGARLSASGLHRLDGDTTWTHLGWSNPRISGVAFDPSVPQRRYLAAGNGVMVSQNAGQAWRIPTDWRVTEVQDVAAEPGRAYAATAYGIWRSLDGGITWAEANTGIPTMDRYTQDIEADPTRTGHVLAATDRGVYVSTDAAASWTRTSAPMTVYDLAQSAAAPTTWYAATRGHGLLRSTDGGASWQDAAPAFRTTTFMMVAADPFDARRVAAASWGQGVVVTTNGGRTWTSRTRGLPVPNTYAVVYDVNVRHRLWAATVEAGIFRSDDDGRTWRYAGMNGTLVFDLTFLPDTP